MRDKIWTQRMALPSRVYEEDAGIFGLTQPSFHIT